jgi:uncharacterized protein YbjT (DUF2867 family)
MKVIVAGATGLAGQGIARAALEDERISKVLIITRRAAAKDIESNPKSEVILHQDFSTYPEDLLKKLEGAEACLWYASSPRFLAALSAAGAVPRMQA